MKPQFNSPEEFAESIQEQFDLFETLGDMLRPENEEEYEDEVNY